MKNDPLLRSVQTPLLSSAGDPAGAGRDAPQPSLRGSGPSPSSAHPVYRLCWFAVNIALLASLVLVIVTAFWEYSTRRYLKGFSDAVIPAMASPENKVGAILGWMSDGPTRLPAGPITTTTDRDPTDTLNYEALLKVCGSATNAFINLADSAGLSSRRLLLLGPNLAARHVVAEVLIDGRWIVVDPSFRAMLRGPDGTLLTRQDLAVPALFAAATRSLPDYDSDYTYERTVHVRVARMKWIGRSLRYALDRLVPGWEDSSTISLLAERESFSALVGSIFLLLFVILLRTGFRWYGESRLGVQSVRFREQLRRAGHALLDTAG